MHDMIRYRVGAGVLAVATLLPGMVCAQESAAGADGAASDAVAVSRGLIAHWPLAGDARDHSAGAHHARPVGSVDFDLAGRSNKPQSAAGFNGRDAYLEVPDAVARAIGKGDFTWSAWVHTDRALDDVPGDLVSQYDPTARRGFHLTLKSNAAVANSQANFRQLQFGIDNHQETDWVDRGRPGNTILAFALAVCDGQLYAGTCEAEVDGTGHVYRYDGGTKWVDCGAPVQCNAVTSLAVLDGKLYVGTGKYRLRGSALAESPNTNLGGEILRYDGDGHWTPCGRLPDVEAIGALAVYRDQLYASSLYRPASFYRYEGGTRWVDCGTPGKRVEALGVYNGYIYATSYDGGLVFRFDGAKWTDCGQLGSAEENTQTYSFAVYQGRLYVGTWRSGRVYRFEGVDQWTDVGRLGEELEVMGMLVHNGRLMAGTLPLAEVYDYAGGQTWRRMKQLDTTPDVRYRRAWTMAEFNGEVFCSTLPSGNVWSYRAGCTAMADRSLPPGWHHVAAVKSSDRLRLYVDGKLAAKSRSFEPSDHDLTCDAPLRIGFGQNDYFFGRMSDVRCYSRALTHAEVGRLATQ